MSSERARALLAKIDADDIDGAEADAEVLWVTDQDRFWELLDEEVARGRHSLELGLALMRAIQSLPRPDAAALARVFRIVVQRFIPERPRPEAQELVRFTEQLRALSPEPRDPVWLLIGSASAHLHHLNWLVSQGEDTDLKESLRALNELFTAASEEDLTPRDHLQLATTLGQYAGLTGDGRWLSVARQSLVLARERYHDLALQWALPILIKFAQATGDAEVWREVIERGAWLLEQPEPGGVEELIRHKRLLEFTHYHLAIVHGYLGERAIGLAHLAESVVLNKRRIHAAVSDNDMAPLLHGAGSVDFSFDTNPD